MNFILDILVNKSSKYNKAIVAALSATISISYILGYPDFAAKAAIVGGFLGVTLVGNPKEIVVVDPATPTA